MKKIVFIVLTLSSLALAAGQPALPRAQQQPQSQLDLTWPGLVVAGYAGAALQVAGGAISPYGQGRIAAAKIMKEGILYTAPAVVGLCALQNPEYLKNRPQVSIIRNIGLALACGSAFLDLANHNSPASIITNLGIGVVEAYMFTGWYCIGTDLLDIAKERFITATQKQNQEDSEQSHA